MKKNITKKLVFIVILNTITNLYAQSLPKCDISTESLGQIIISTNKTYFYIDSDSVNTVEEGVIETFELAIGKCSFKENCDVYAEYRSEDEFIYTYLRLGSDENLVPMPAHIAKQTIRKLQKIGFCK